MPKKQNEIVKKSNALIRSHWTIESVLEPRIIAVLASKVYVNDEDFKMYQIPVKEFLGDDYGGHDLRELETVVEKIMSRVITIYDAGGVKDWAKYNVFSRCGYKSKEGVLELCFHPDLKSHYLQLKERFTQYSLTEFMSLPSIYSQRLYEVLKSWSDKPEIEIEITELYNMLDVSPSMRKDFRQFRMAVLERAHRDIVERGDSSLWFDWEPIKGNGRGGKIIAVRFVFSEVRSQELLKNQSLDGISIHYELQQKSNTCYESTAKNGISCTPNLKTKKCEFCTTRGRMSRNSQ